MPYLDKDSVASLASAWQAKFHDENPARAVIVTLQKDTEGAWGIDLMVWRILGHRTVRCSSSAIKSSLVRYIREQGYEPETRKIHKKRGKYVYVLAPRGGQTLLPHVHGVDFSREEA